MYVVSRFLSRILSGKDEDEKVEQKTLVHTNILAHIDLCICNNHEKKKESREVSGEVDVVEKNRYNKRYCEHNDGENTTKN